MRAVEVEGQPQVTVVPDMVLQQHIWKSMLLKLLLPWHCSVLKTNKKKTLTLTTKAFQHT